MPRVERPLVAVPDRRRTRRCRERTDPQIVAWRDRGERRRYPTWHRTVKVRAVGKEPVIIAGDICVDRSPPKVCSTWWQTMGTSAATARRWPSRCSPTSRLGSDRDRSASRWSVEPPHAVEGAVSGVNGRWRHRAVVYGRIGSPGWAAVALVLSAPVGTSSDRSSCSRRGRSSAPSPAPARRVGGSVAMLRFKEFGCAFWDTDPARRGHALRRHERTFRDIPTSRIGPAL